MQIKWFKDKDGSLWYADFENKAIYVIFDTRLEKEGWFVGVYRNVKKKGTTVKGKKIKTFGDVIYDKPLFYDGFTLNQAKELVKNMVGDKNEKKDKKVECVNPIKRNRKK